MLLRLDASSSSTSRAHLWIRPSSDDAFVQLRHGDQDRQVHTGARTTTSTMMRVQVPSTCFSPSTVTVRSLGSVKFIYENMYDRRRNRKVPLRTDITKYHDTDDIHYYCRRGFHQVQLLWLRTVMTRTSTDVYDHRCPKNRESQASRTTTVDPRSLRGCQVPRRDPEHLRKIVQLRT